MKRAYKTSKKKRTNYIYYTAEGTKIVIIPGEDGVTEADIELLHTMDDDEVDEQRRYDYRVTTHLDAYHDGEEEAANDRNKYLADDTANPEQLIIQAEDEAEHQDMLDKLTKAMECLLPQQKELFKKVYLEKRSKWRPETLKKILQNEKYIGDALLQKTYTVDFLSKKRVVNNGIVPQYYVENSHEPIIPRGIFMQVQEELVRRANLYTGKNGKKRVYSSKYALSSIVYCSECGEIYRRVHWNNRGCRSIVWRCVSRLEEKGSDCTSPTVNEEVLQAAVVKAINELLASKDTFLSTLQANIETVLNEEHDKITNDIDVKLEELQNELLRLANSKTDYEEVAEEIYRLREQKQNALVENAEREGKRQRIAEMTDFLNEQSCELEEYDEQLVRRLIEKVTIYEDKLTVEFKSGIEIDEEI